MSAKTITGRLSLLFLAFVAIVIISAGTTFWGLEATKTDALVINLAGRQRMLIQQMTRQATALAQGDQSMRSQDLIESVETFDLTLTALKDGGSAPYINEQNVILPGSLNLRTSAALNQLGNLWIPYRQELKMILSNPLGSAAVKQSALQLQNQTPAMVEQADVAVREFENAAARKVLLLRWGQGIFLVSGLMLSVIGWFVIRRAIILPLQQLKQYTEEIARGNLEAPVVFDGPSEIQILSASFDHMRTRLLSSKQELLNWTQTLEEKVRQRTSELEALYTVSGEITARLDVHQVLNTITDKTRDLLGGDLAFLCLQDKAGQTLRLHAANGPEIAILRSDSPSDAPFPKQVLKGREAVTCNAVGCNGYCTIVAPPYRRSHLAAPLYAGNRVIGALCVGSSREHAFSKESPELLTKLANVAAIALENARLYEQAERAAVLEERQRIAADMHDGLAQTISYLNLMVDTAQEHLESGQLEAAATSLEKSESAINQASRDIRRAIASLQENFPVNYTLQDQLKALVAEFNQDDIAVNCVIIESKPLILPSQESEQVLRVVREALLNAARHSQANRVEVIFEKSNRKVCVTISDDGRGFKEDQVSSSLDPRRHFGLNIMRARASRLNGELEISSQPGKGTRVMLTWPLREAELTEESPAGNAYAPN